MTTERIIDRRCLHCCKWKMEHKANTHHCPIGKRHRTLGYLGYSSDVVYAPNMKRKPLTSRLSIL